MTFRIDQADAIAYMRQLPDKSVDLVFGSPPYEKARLYLENGEDLKIARSTEEWVAWMVEIYREASRVCKGLVAFVVDGQTKNYRYSCGPMLLAADLHRAGLARRAVKRKRPLQRVLLRTATGWRRKTLFVSSLGEGYEFYLPKRRKPCKDSPEAGLLDFLNAAVAQWLEKQSQLTSPSGSAAE